MHINSLFHVVHLCEFAQKSAKRSQDTDPHAPTNDKPLNLIRFESVKVTVERQQLCDINFTIYIMIFKKI